MSQPAAGALGTGFKTGTDCVRLSDNEIEAYMVGVTDGLLVSPVVGASESCILHYHKCMQGMTNYQLGAVLRKWLKENPERWHQGCNIASWRAIHEMCAER